MSAHTPGPWAVAIWPEGRDHAEQFREHASHGAGPIWGVWCPQHPLSKGEHPTPEHAVMAALTGNGPASEANAWLIAAAPDLLEALAGTVQALEQTCNILDESPSPSARIASMSCRGFLIGARAAIAKTEWGSSIRAVTPRDADHPAVTTRCP